MIVVWQGRRTEKFVVMELCRMVVHCGSCMLVP